MKNFFAQLQLIILLALFFCFSGCFPGPKSRCDMPQDFIIEEAKMYLTITQTFPLIHENEVHFELLKNQAFSPPNYFPTQFMKFPLPANVESLSFLLKDNDGVTLDTLYINYHVDAKLYKGDLCNDPQLIPVANNKKCNSTNHYFQVISYQ